MESTSANLGDGNVLDQDDYDVKVDVGYGRSVSRRSIGGSIGYSGATVELNKNGKTKFALAAIKDVINEMSNSQEGDKKTFSKEDIQKIYEAYPDPHDVDHEELYGLIGGDLEKHYKEIMANGTDKEKEWWANACATRLSYAFNKAGFSIPFIDEAKTWAGKDNLYYFVKADIMGNYLKDTYTYETIKTPGGRNNTHNLDWGVVAIYDMGRGRIGHVDVIWDSGVKGNYYTWDKYFIFGHSTKK